MRALVVVVVIVIGFATLIAFGQGLEIRDRYICSGEGPNGVYQIELTIDRRGDNYFLSWDNGRIYGMGFRRYGYFVTAMVDARTAGIGVALYEIRINQLVGQWAVGDGALFAESCLAGPKGVSAPAG